MAFGQQTGPSASTKQVAELLALVERAGHADFRDARGPLGLNQRQARGAFTTAEATELIERLSAELGDDEAPAPPPKAAARPAPRAAAPAKKAGTRLSEIDPEVLATELRRRGWTVEPPPPF